MHCKQSLQPDATDLTVKLLIILSYEITSRRQTAYFIYISLHLKSSEDAQRLSKIRHHQLLSYCNFAS